MFEKAARLKLRFETPNGQLSVEDLWEIPLSSTKARANLDDIARALHRQLKNDDDVSFVKKAQMSDATVQLKFDIVRHVINVRMAEDEARAQARLNKEKEQRILQIMAARQDKALENASDEELQRLIAELQAK